MDQESYRRLVLGETKGVAATACRLGLAPLAFFYRSAVGLRNLAYDRGWKAANSAPVPVVCIGNLTVGGTGKTPMVEYFARRFLEQKLRVAVLSRGYAGAGGRNDEAMLLERNLPDVPHFQGPDRTSLAKLACETTQSQVLILDDGFQHRRLKRDLDVALIDATAPFGGGKLLPAGLLREPLTGLKRAHLIVLTRCDSVSEKEKQRIRDQVAKIAGEKPWAEVRFSPIALESADGKRLPIESLCNARIGAFCGIGNPQGFFTTLKRLGADAVDCREFPDHHLYDKTNLANLSNWAQNLHIEMVLVTQKDLVKFQNVQIGGVPLYALRIEARVENGQAELEEAILRISESARHAVGAGAVRNEEFS